MYLIKVLFATLFVMVVLAINSFCVQPLLFHMMIIIVIITVIITDR